MMFITENIESWYKKIGMYPRNSKCANCNREVSVDIPVLLSKHHGLASEIHECGEDFRIIRLRPRSLSAQAELNEALDLVVPVN